MKARIFLFLLLAVIAVSCEDESEETNVNLISNPNFETNAHDSTFSGWYSTCYLPGPVDNPMPPLVMTAPPGGGSWSMCLVPEWLPAEGFAETYITGQNGHHVYKLSSWMMNFKWLGTMSLQQWRNGLMISNKTLQDSSSVWKQIFLYDTLDVLPADTLCIRLSAGSTEVSNGSVWFDLVCLTIE